MSFHFQKVRKTENDNMEAPEDGIKQKEQESEEEEIPQLVPIETPTKRPKRMVSNACPSQLYSF